MKKETVLVSDQTFGSGMLKPSIDITRKDLELSVENAQRPVSAPGYVCIDDRPSLNPDGQVREKMAGGTLIT